MVRSIAAMVLCCTDFFNKLAFDTCRMTPSTKRTLD
jgi:hypothetical protein